MTRYVHTVEIERPVGLVYQQWEHVERFPMFMTGVVAVAPTGDGLYRWDIKVAGLRRRLDAVVVEDEPEHRIRWRSVEGPAVVGEVAFAEVGLRRTRLSVTVDFVPHGLVETVGDELGLVSNRVKADLLEFKDFVETIGRPPQTAVPEPVPNVRERVPEQAAPPEESLADLIFGLAEPRRPVKQVPLRDRPVPIRRSRR